MKVFGKPKIFCVGCNKTGTTSLQMALKEFGFIVGDQRQSENLLEDWGRRDFENIIKYCRSAQVFQDVPFSLPDTFKVMDQAFPESRFILTIRDSAEQWYSSLIRSQQKLCGVRNGQLPSKENLQNATYIYKGRPWRENRLVFNTPESDPYHKETLVSFYGNHNRSVRDYFVGREQDMLVINVAEEDSYRMLCDFLHKAPLRDSFPWENQT